MADLSKLRFNGTDYNVKDASAPLRKFTNYSKTGNLPITSDDTTQTAIGKLEKALDSKINTSAKGTASGVAELDANGKVPSYQLPSYVDDVLEYSAKSSFPATGETGKIYVDTSSNKTYRWSGSAYVEISESLALGDTSSTAYRGDRGKAAYDHSQASGNPHGTTGAGVNLTGYSKGSSTAAVAATDTINAAFAKHENRIDANQTNILYAVHKVGKNDFNVPVFVKECEVSNGTKVITDESIKLTATSADCFTIPEYNTNIKQYPREALIPVNSGEKIVFSWVYTPHNSQTNDRVGIFGNGTYDQGKYLTAPSIDGSLEYTVPSDVTYVTVRVGVATSGNSATYSEMMVSKKTAYDADPTYQPFSLPNYDLTRMVSELQKKAVKVYTYHVNPNESDPEDAVTYLDDATGLTPAKMGASSFSYGSWANAWFLPRPCVLKFDGTVDYYLNPNDYSKKTDGTASTIDSSNSTGNVMLEFPKIWVKRVNDGNGARTVSIAPVNVDGTYKCWSNINAEDKEVDHFYLPAYNGTIHSSKMRSLSGVTLNSTYAPNYTRAQEVTAATANNPTGKNMWYTETWADFCLIYDLLYLMGKSLDVQRTFGQGLSSGSETAMRAYVTGTHNAKGLFYGDISGTSTAVKVLGMENLWGCRWHGVAGLINDNGTFKIKMTYGVADGSTAVGYNTTGSGYLNYGSTYGTAGFVKKMQADNTMGYKIIETAGTDATYYCDYYYVNNSVSAYALLGGGSDYGAACGFCVTLRDGAAHAYWAFGGSLSCRP